MGRLYADRGPGQAAGRVAWGPRVETGPAVQAEPVVVGSFPRFPSCPARGFKRPHFCLHNSQTLKSVFPESRGGSHPGPSLKPHAEILMTSLYVFLNLPSLAVRLRDHKAGF